MSDSDTHTTYPTTNYLRTLTEAGLDDIVVLRRETAKRVLTEKRTELLEQIATGEIESVRHLARRVERDLSIVSRDLDVLVEAEVVDYEQDGQAKRPILAHENIFVKPVVVSGRVAATETETE
jgi:predicted transcriptional regulator